MDMTRTLAALGVSALLLTACGADGDTDAPGAATSDAAAADGGDTGAAGDGADTATAADSAVATSFPVTVDNCGETLTFDAPPQRIVTYYQPTLELVVALGAGDRVIARQPLEDEAVPEAWRSAMATAPEVFDAGVVPSAEQVLDLEPDLVVVESEAFGLNAEQGAATREQLAGVGASPFVLSYRCDADPPEDVVSGALGDLAAMGAILGLEAEAAELADDLRQRLRVVAERLEGQEPVRIVWIDPIKPDVAGLGAYGGGARMEIVTLAGTVSVLPPGPSDYISEVSDEQIIAADPDVLLINDYPEGSEFYLSVGEAIALFEERFPTVRAVQDGAYASVTNASVTSSPRMVDTVEDLAAQFHPDLFGG